MTSASVEHMRHALLAVCLITIGVLVYRNWDGWHSEFHATHPELCNPYKGECR